VAPLAAQVAGSRPSSRCAAKPRPERGARPAAIAAVALSRPARSAAATAARISTGAEMTDDKTQKAITELRGLVGTRSVDGELNLAGAALS
jgi:hypothetical protein